MRALGDPDAFPPGDAALRRAVAALGGPSDAGGMAKLARRWRPWRSYAVHHLWASLPSATSAHATATRTHHGGRS
jgi:AraC family transcriptional regulator of adaptative response / DNA-3-methyladenine glycosylase II